MAVLHDDLCSHYLNLEFSDNFISDSDAQIHVGNPYPVHKPFKHGDRDIVDDYHTNLADYRNKLCATSNDFQVVNDNLINQDFGGTYVTATRGILDLCDRDNDEVSFKSDYNPYYATGVLEEAEISNEKYLIRPNIKNQLCLSKIKSPSKIYKIKLESSLERILGISSASRGCFLLQHRKSVSLIKINSLYNNAQIKYCKKSKNYILGSKLSHSRLGLIYSNLKFRLYDIETNKKISLDCFEAENPTRFDFFVDSIAILGEKFLKIADTRSRDCKLLKPDLNPCNTLTNFKICDGNTVYLTTRHFLVRTDLRFLDNIEFCSHLMRFSPCYLSQSEDKQFLALSAQKFNEKTIFCGHPVDNLPRKVGDLDETLTQCRLRNDVFLKPGLDERVTFSTTGIRLIKEDNEHFLYHVNSIGELFKQKISTSSDQLLEDSTDPALRLFDWIGKLPEPPRLLHVTNFADASHVRFALNKRIKTENLRKFTRGSKKCALFLNHYNNVYSKSNLGDLAGNFASIWDDEDAVAGGEVDLGPEVAPLDKVTSWIQSSNYFAS